MPVAAHFVSKLAYEMCQFYPANFVSTNQKMVEPKQPSLEAAGDVVRSRNDLVFAGCRESTSI